MNTNFTQFFLYFEKKGIIYGLDLSNNMLVNISYDKSVSGNCLSFVTYFTLRNNSIERLNMTGFDSLRVLDLTHNNLTSLDSQEFTGCSKTLETLTIVHNQISSISPDTFYGLFNLTNLELSYNNLTDLDPTLFRDLIRLYNLGLEGNSLTSLDPDIFANLTSLTRLNLAYNNILTIDGFKFVNSIFIDVSFNQLSAINTNTMNSSNNIITLNINNNQFRSTENITLIGLDHIESFDLSSNILENFDGGSNSYNLSNLSELKLRNLRLNSSMAGFILRKFLVNDLYSLDLGDNELENAGEWISLAFKSIKVLKLDSNMIDSVSINSLAELYSLDLSKNLLKSIDADTFKGLFKLKDIDLSNNLIENLNEDTFKGLTLDGLNLSGNQIVSIEDFAFRGLIVVENFYLNLANNSLTELGENTLAGIEFRYVFYELFKLDISNNTLDKIDPNAFTQLGSNLTFLDLTNNEIEELDLTSFLMLTNLQGIGLSGNDIYSSYLNTTTANLCKQCFLF